MHAIVKFESPNAVIVLVPDLVTRTNP